MNIKIEARLNMYHQVIDLCESNLAIIALVAAFSTSYNVFKTTVTAIVAGAADLEAQTGGLSTSKKTAKKSLATMGSGIAGMVGAFASVEGDETLEAAMQISATKINKALDDEVVSICTNIYNAANDNLANLADYGVTGPLLTTFQTAINDYASKAPKPKQSRNYKKAVRSQIVAMLKDADSILNKQMDKLAVNFISNGNATFEAQYRAARVYVEPGSFSTVLKIEVINGGSNLPIVSAKCYRDASATFKRSTKKGFVTYKDIEQGNHSFVLKHKLFNDLLLSGVMMSYGERKTVTAVMVPIGSGGGITIVREFNIAIGGLVNVDLTGIKGTSGSSITIEVSGAAGVRLGAAANATDPPGPQHYDKESGTVTMSLDTFIELCGFGPGMTFLIAQNIGMVATHVKLTFTNLAP